MLLAARPDKPYTRVPQIVSKPLSGGVGELVMSVEVQVEGDQVIALSTRLQALGP